MVADRFGYVLCRDHALTPAICWFKEAAMPIESPKSTAGMINYDCNSTAHKQAVNRHAERIGALIDCLETVGPELRVTDFGCGPGLSTVGVAGPAIDTFRRSAQDNPTDIFAGFIDDTAAYGRHYADFVRAFAVSTPRSHLFEPSAAGGNDASAVADAFYARLETLCAAHPGQHAFEVWDLTLVRRRH